MLCYYGTPCNYILRMLFLLFCCLPNLVNYPRSLIYELSKFHCKFQRGSILDPFINILLSPSMLQWLPTLKGFSQYPKACLQSGVPSPSCSQLSHIPGCSQLSQSLAECILVPKPDCMQLSQTPTPGAQYSELMHSLQLCPAQGFWKGEILP